MNRLHTLGIIWFALPFLGAILVSCVDNVGGVHHLRCDVGNLDLVFSDPVKYRGQRFCGQAVGIPDRVSILFFPVSREHADINYDTVMFITDRHISDNLRLRNTGPFRTYLEGTIEPMSECFSAAARRGEVECAPVRHPINLRVTQVNEVSPQTGMRAADRLPPPARSTDNEDRIPGAPVGTARSPNRSPNDQNESPHAERLSLEQPPGPWR